MKPSFQLAAAGTRCRVSVPGSTSNLGPGFDSIGCAVAVRNEFEFEVTGNGGEGGVALSGSSSDGIPTTRDNLALATARDFFERMGVKAPTLKMRASIEVPSARGLGSSSTAIVAGLVAANQLLDCPLSPTELLDVAVEIEGHPDNVAPAMLGGLIVAAAYSKPLSYFRVPVHWSVSFLFTIPDYMVHTSDARARLPQTIPFADAIFNSSRSPLVLMALQSGDLKPLRTAMEDRLHQPYRKPLFKSYDDFERSALGAGAAGFCVSGAGPTMLAVCTRETITTVTSALEATLKKTGIGGVVREIPPDNEGTTAKILP